MRRAVTSIVLLASLAALGCVRGHEGTREPEVVDSQPEPDPEPDEQALAAEQACRAPQRFADYDWVPDDARLATSIQLDHPELADALALLEARSSDAALQLPVFAALEFRNLGLQLGNLSRLLGALELDPAELVELQSPRGEFVWTWSTNCPPPIVAARALDRFGVMLRADLERPGLRRGAGSAERFPFDLLTLGEHRVALTLAGHGERVGAWLHDADRGGDEGPGQQLRDTPHAPIRAVLNGEALLDSSSDGPSVRRRTIRVTASEWTAE